MMIKIPLFHSPFFYLFISCLLSLSLFLFISVSTSFLLYCFSINPSDLILIFPTQVYHLIYFGLHDCILSFIVDQQHSFSHPHKMPLQLAKSWTQQGQTGVHSQFSSFAGTINSPLRQEESLNTHCHQTGNRLATARQTQMESWGSVHVLGEANQFPCLSRKCESLRKIHLEAGETL